MQKQNKFGIVIILSLVFNLVIFSTVDAWTAPAQIHITQDTTWTKETPNLILDKLVVVENGATLTIEAGTRIVFQLNPDQPFDSAGIQVIDGKLIADGTQEEQIVFTSPDDGFVLSFNDSTQTSSLRFITIENGGFIPTSEGGGDFVPQQPVLTVGGGKLHMENSKFVNSRYTEIDIQDATAYDANWNQLYDADGNEVINRAQIEVINSNFSRQAAVISHLDCWAEDADGNDYIDQTCIKRVSLSNDWYGNPTGPTTDKDKEDGNIKGYRVAGFVWVDSWKISDEIIDDSVQACSENCFSNILFLPGIEASRLYKDGLVGTTDQLWPPNYFGNDMKNLALDEDGRSVENVFTKDALEDIGIFGLGGNIYKTFLANLKDLKTKKTINDYESFAYDWRQNAEDIAKNGTAYEDITKSVVADLQTLAGSSKSKKVTIVAHSNGGLVAKAVMLELEKLGLADKVDKIIFVGTPQMGTPSALLAMLYGYDQALLLGTLVSREDARTLTENMPGAYGLLPSEKYFDRMQDPFVNFSSQRTGYKNFKDAYGDDINNYSEFKNFLLGVDDKRSAPKSSDVESEEVLNKKLLEQADEMHSRLDNWTPPASVQVTQIAGWGLDTLSGVNYTEEEKINCYATLGAKIPSCTGMGEYKPVYEPKFTVDGDKTVVTPSALMLSEADNVKDYWVDMYNYNKSSKFITARQHKDILEITDVDRFISKIITNVNISNSLPEFIKASRPDDYAGAKPRLRMSLHSPLDIHLYDDAGNHTGPKEITDADGNKYTIFEEGIPNSYYYQYGERKYVGFPSDEHIRVEMDGYALGSYTLKLDEVQETKASEKITAHTAFENLPTTAKATVKLDIPKTGIAQVLSLQADMDSDGTADYVVDSVPDGSATMKNAVTATTSSASSSSSSSCTTKKSESHKASIFTKPKIQFNLTMGKFNTPCPDNFSQSVPSNINEQIGADNVNLQVQKTSKWIIGLFGMTEARVFIFWF